MPFEEHQRIPFEPWAPAARRALVLAPHPDDEVIGCGGLIAHLRGEGATVRVVVATDGAEGLSSSPGPPAEREEESRLGLDLLGVSDVLFLRFPDRALVDKQAELERRLLAEIGAFDPDLVVVPSLVEIHPDHLSLARAAIAALQSDRELAARSPLMEIAFYEVSQPFAPNRLLDITSHREKKGAAIALHRTQLARLPYDDYAAGLNRYRSMTLGAECAAAEGYWIASIQRIAATPASELALAMSPAPPSLSQIGELEPVSVVIRTKNRPEWLREAVDSALANTHPVRVVVVNDGGRPPELPSDPRLTILNLEESAGRSEAMNRGVEATATELVCFLDDDDLYSPEHVATLAAAMREGTRAAFYTDAASVSLIRDEQGEWIERSRERRYASDYDDELLRFDNYIPLPTIIVRRDDYLSIGGFDPSLDLFEDWDFLLRLQRKGPFERIPRVTCTIRHFAGSDSIIQAAQNDRNRLVEGKTIIWERHGFPEPPALARALERMKARTRALEDALSLARGGQQHALRDVDRLEHEKSTLIGKLGTETRRANETQARVADLEAQVGNYARDNERLTGDVLALIEVKDELERTVERMTSQASELWGEIDRLNALLSTIYASKTWKLHTTVERLKGHR